MKAILKFTHLIACLTISITFSSIEASAQTTIDFEDAGSSLALQSFNNGSDGSDSFTSGGIQFDHTFTDFGGGFTGWDGWSLSNVVDSTTPGPDNQYAAFPGSGAGASSSYAVAFPSFATGNVSLTLPATNAVFQSLDITNTTYTLIALRDGDDGGNNFVTGPLEPVDGFLELVITGSDSSGAETGSQTVALADYRNGNSILRDSWETVDVSALDANTLSFTFAGSDANQFGLLSPTFFAADNIVFAAVPEPSSLAILLSLGGLAVTRRRRSAI